MPLGDICITSPADVQFNCNLRDKLKLFPAANIHTYAVYPFQFSMDLFAERKIQPLFSFKY